MKRLLSTATALAIVLGGTLSSAVALAASYAPDYSQPVSPTTSEFAPMPLNTVSPEGEAMLAPRPGRLVVMAPTGFGHLSVR